VGRYVLLPGDPGRCELIAGYFDDTHFVTRHREFTTYTGALLARWKAWKQGGAICSEMEVATIFILGSLYRKRTGGVMLISGNQESDEPPHQSSEAALDTLIQTAVSALKILIAQDRESPNFRM